MPTSCCESLHLMWDLFPNLRSPSLRGCPRPPQRVFLGRFLCGECVSSLERMLGFERSAAAAPV